MTGRDLSRPNSELLERAWEAVGSLLPATPLIQSPKLGCLLKLESLQPTGSFKVRGATAALALTPSAAAVITASAGNHGLGVAWAASYRGVRVTVVIPEDASPAKAEALRQFPVELIETGSSYDDAEAFALALADSRGARFISPYNDGAVIAGQATVGKEILQQTEGSAERSLTIVCPVGGGGLIAGIALQVAGRAGVTVIGVESALSRSMSSALAAGEIVRVSVGDSLADGLTGNLEPGSITFGIVRDHVAKIATVTEEEIAAAIRFLAREHGLVVEGSGAAATAAVLAGHVPVAANATLVAIVSGRNVAPKRFVEIIGVG